MKRQGGGFVIAVADVNASTDFYCKAMQLQTIASDATSAMLGPQDGNDEHPWLLALRHAGRSPVHTGRNAAGVRALFFCVDIDDLDDLEQRLRDLGGFHERHIGEFYEMVSAYDPDRTAIGFWAVRPDAGVDAPSFVPPSVYFLDN